MIGHSSVFKVAFDQCLMKIFIIRLIIKEKLGNSY